MGAFSLIVVINLLNRFNLKSVWMADDSSGECSDLNLSESKALLHNQANTDVATTPVATTINISSTTSGLVSVPQTAKVRSLHEHQSNSSVYNDAFVNTTNSHSTQPKSSQSDVYNNGKDHLTQSKVLFCSLPKKRLTMVVHLFSVAFVIAVAIVMRTGTSGVLHRTSNIGFLSEQFPYSSEAKSLQS